jgi:predicted secreted protein
MKTIIVFICVSFMASCSIFSSISNSPTTTLLTASDTDREIVFAQNHFFSVVLPSNPTTGYSWNIDVDNPSIISVQSQKYKPDSSGRVGVGGTTTWTLLTHEKGNAAITYSYQRPWEEKTPPTRVVTFSISVH